MILSFYTDSDYCFDMSETLALAERLSAEEKSRYPVDPADYEWEDYIRKIHLPGLNRYGLRNVKPSIPEPQLDLTELDLSAAG